MPTRRAAAQELINMVQALRLAGRFEDAEETAQRAREAIGHCAPRDKKPLLSALEDAKLAMPAPAGTHPMPASYHEVEGVDELVDKGVAQARQAVDAGLKTADMARTIAETLLEARLKMRNKAGLPDIIASSKLTKNIAHDLFVQAREGVSEEDVDRWSTHQSLAKAVRNRMSDVVVDFLRGLDKDPGRFPADALARCQMMFPYLPATEAVYQTYAHYGFELPRKGRTEMAREQARLKALRLKELEEGQEDSEIAPDVAALERMERSFDRLTARAQKMSKEERANLKARINETIANLAAKAAKL